MASERSDFDNLTSHSDMNNLEASANDPSASKEGYDLFWCRVCSDIKIFGSLAQQKISDGATNDEGAVIVLAQTSDNGNGRF